MKTEDLLRYEMMYREMRAALGTHWLHFEHNPAEPGSCQPANGRIAQRRLREPAVEDAFQRANKEIESL